MSQQINVNIRMDKDVKEQADKLFNELGFNFTTAINTFVKQSLRERAIPFYIKADNTTSGSSASKTTIKSRNEMFGALRGKYKIAADFDAPLNDFKEYME